MEFVQNKLLNPIASKTSKTRIEYLDAIRGTAIILVIISHIIIHVLSIDSNHFLHKFNIIATSFRMPVFFFISGFFVYKDHYTISLLKKYSYNRIFRQLYPAILLGALCCILFFDSRFTETFTHETKMGYWFIFTLFEMFFLIAPFLFFISSNNWLSRINPTVVIGIYACFILSVLYLIKSLAPEILVNTLGINYLLCYFVYFVFGVLFKINYNNIRDIVTNKYFGILLFIAFFIFFYVIDFSFSTYVKGVLSILIMHFLFYHIFNKKEVINKKISKGLIYLGTMTLEIYLLHNFIIYYFAINHNLGDYINNINIFVSFSLVILAAITITLMCLCINNLLISLKIKPLIFPTKK